MCRAVERLKRLEENKNHAMSSKKFPNLVVGLSIAGAGLVGMSIMRRRRRRLPKEGVKPFVIIGITGTIGAGKGTVVEHLKTRYGFRHFSARELLYEIIDAQGLSRDRDSLRKVANMFRRKKGADAIAVELFSRASRIGKNAILESLRTEGEIRKLRDLGIPFVLLAVDADAKTRYDRVMGRGSSTDKVGFETFLEQERKEWASSDPHKQNLRRCMELADVSLQNDDDVESFTKRIDQAMMHICNTRRIPVTEKAKKTKRTNEETSTSKARRGGKVATSIHIDRNGFVTYRKRAA